MDGTKSGQEDRSITPPQLVGTITTINQAVNEMLADLELSPLTKQTYRHGLNALLRFLHSRGDDDAGAPPPCPIGRINEDTLSAFNRWLRQAYPDPRAASADESSGTRTTRTYLVAAKRLMNWLDLHDLLPQGVSYERMVRRIDEGRGRRRQGYRQRRVDPQVMRVLTHYMRKPLPPSPGPSAWLCCETARWWPSCTTRVRASARRWPSLERTSSTVAPTRSV